MCNNTLCTLRFLCNQTLARFGSVMSEPLEGHVTLKVMRLSKPSLAFSLPVPPVSPLEGESVTAPPALADAHVALSGDLALPVSQSSPPTAAARDRTISTFVASWCVSGGAASACSGPPLCSRVSKPRETTPPFKAQ